MMRSVWKLLSDYDQPELSLIEKAPMLLVRMRADGAVLDAEAETFAGYRAEDIVGRAFWLDVAHPDDRWRLTDALRRTAEERARTTVEVRFTTPRQEPRLARLYLIPAEPSAQAAVEAFAFDVTGQADAEADLLQSDAFYQAFLEQSPMGILHLDASGIVIFENHAFRQIVGEGVDDAWIGRRLADMPGLEAGVKPSIDRMLADGTPLHGEATTYQRSEGGDPAHLVVHGSPIRQADGGIVGGVVMVEDMTEQRLREEELRLRERYENAEVVLREAVLADLNDIVFLHEAAALLGETTHADRIHLLIHLGDEGHCATRATWACDEDDEPFSLYVDSGLYPALRTAVVRGLSLHLHARAVPEGAAELHDLTEADEVIWAPFFDTGRLGGFVLFERRTGPAEASIGGWSPAERRLIERLVRHFEALWSWIQVGQRYQFTVATIEDCLFTYSFSPDHNTRHYLFITPQIKSLTGYEAETVLARTDWIETLVHKDDHVPLRAHDQALRHGRESRLAYRIHHRDGSLRWLSEQATPHHDAAGRVTVSGILTDVTDQKDAEAILVNAREQATSVSRLKSTFVSTMSHELRTPLGAVNGFADLLADELAEWEAQTGQTLPPQMHEFADAVRQNAKRLLMLADDLFVLSNMEIGALRLDRAALRLNPLVQRAADKIGDVIAEKNLALEIDLDPADLLVLGDVHRIEQVLDHLLANAAKFTDAGRVIVRTRSAGDEVLIEVADTGIGIEQAHLDKLFTPFLQEDNRLNRRYQGAGLGLALVKRLLDVMDGRIEVESEKGKGSTFRVFLPAATKS